MGEIVQRIMGQVALHMPLSSQDADHPGALIRGHVTPLGWPMGEGEIWQYHA